MRVIAVIRFRSYCYHNNMIRAARPANPKTDDHQKFYSPHQRDCEAAAAHGYPCSFFRAGGFFSQAVSVRRSHFQVLIVCAP